MNVVVDSTEVALSGVSANVNSNVDSNCVMAKVAQGAVDRKGNVEQVLDASVYGVGEVDMSGSGDCAMSLNEELSDCGVSKNTSVGAGCCPTDSLYPSRVRTAIYDQRGRCVRLCGHTHCRAGCVECR
jgi:hypothetical protein